LVFLQERRRASPVMWPVAPTGSALRDAAGAIGNPELQQPRNTRDHQQSDCREHPLCKPPPHGKRTNCHERRPAAADRRDHVADPVDQVQESAFRLSPLLTLNSHVDLRRCAEVLCNERCLRGSKKQRYDDGGSNSKPPRAVVFHWDWVIRSFLPRLVVRGCEKHNPISEIAQTDWASLIPGRTSFRSSNGCRRWI